MRILILANRDLAACVALAVTTVARAITAPVRLALRDVIVRYRQTIFGITWVIAQPLVSAGIFTVVFGEIAGLSTGNVPTFLFTLAGMLAWNLFNGSLGRASSSMVGNQSLVQKVFFPRLLVPISSLASVVLDFLVALVLAGSGAGTGVMR